MSQLAAAASASASASRPSEFPDWVLLGRIAHIGRRRDDVASAVAETSDGHRVEVSFVPTDPPALTRCFVHCPDLTAGDFVDEAPFIMAADGAFLLISVFFPRRRFDFIDYFVFRSGPGTPSLDLLPRPYPVGFLSIHVGVLSCGDQYLVVDPEWRFLGDGQMSYNLHIFSSKTKSWCSKAARLPCGMKGYRGWFEPNKVFAIGGGSMAWIDFRNGILLCDSVDEEEHPEVRLIQLPPLMPINDRPGLDFDGDLMPCLDSIRDVTFSNGWFRSIEVGFPHLVDGAEQFQWTATMFKMMISSKECQWEPYGTANSVDISPADSCFPDLFPEIWYPKDNKLALSNVVCLYPTLDMYNDDMVYMIAKIKGTDPSGWVLAVNTAKKKLEKISPFSEESFHFWRIYLQCDFSKHLRKAPGAQLTQDLDKCTNRKKIELLDANLLAQLRNIGTGISFSSKPDDLDEKATEALREIKGKGIDGLEVLGDAGMEVLGDSFGMDPHDLPKGFFLSCDHSLWNLDNGLIWRSHGSSFGYGIGHCASGYQCFKRTYMYYDYKGNHKTNWIMNVYDLIHESSYIRYEDELLCHVFQSDNYDPRPNSFPRSVPNSFDFHKKEVDPRILQLEGLMKNPESFKDFYEFDEMYSKCQVKGRNGKRGEVWEHFTEIKVIGPDGVVMLTFAICHGCNMAYLTGKWDSKKGCLSNNGTKTLKEHYRKCSDQHHVVAGNTRGAHHQMP